MAGNLSLTGASPTVTSSATNANLNLTPNGTGLVTAPTPSSTDNSTDVATTAFVQSHLPSVAGKVSLTGQTGVIGSTTLISSPTTGTYMLAICLWVQMTGSDTVTASVTYSNGTISATDSTTGVSTSSTSNRSCTVISEHIVSGTSVSYSTAISGTSFGTYGLDIVETRVQ